jgi:hypothetical protein
VRVGTLEDVMNLTTSKSLHYILTPTYVLTAGYSSPKEIQEALGLKSDWSWFTLPVKPEDVDIPYV